MRIFLSGLMGAGKSTVAKALAARAGLPHVDLDELIAAEAGSSLSDFFRDRGEAAFRAAERAAIERVIAEQPDAIIALGGGAVLDPQTRRTLLDAGFLCTLEASQDELVRRVAEGQGRPLLGQGDVRARLETLRRERAEAYAETHARIDTTHLSPERVAKQIWESAQLAPIVVPLGSRSYRVFVGSDIRHSLSVRVQELGPVSSILVVTDTHVAPHWGRALASELKAVGHVVHLIELAPGESAKTLETVDTIWNTALDVGLDRGSLIIGIGGGVVGDLAGFAAATLLRGIRVAHVPTTLLSMVDSAIGGKTGFDTRHGKNLIGAFHQPSFVLCDVQVLATLPVAERRAGLAEVVKSAWIDGEASVAQLEADADALVRADAPATLRAIRMAARLKARIVTEDERESGVRAYLNLGHTLGHAIEASSGYAGIRHGEAVSIGIVGACRVAHALGRMPQDAAVRAQRLLDRLGLPTEVDPYLSDRVLSFIGADKKRKGAKVSYVTPGRPGDISLLALTVTELIELLRQR
ncbi:MAG TPA: 3-dehydroquinate synthase [Polyangiales bacterium]|jgi:3-dehydroquinate synthase